MTRKNGLKSVVRERMAKTGESYSIARMQSIKGLPVGVARLFPAEGPGVLFQVRVTLQGASPPIWRQLAVPADFTLGDLAMALIDAMGWHNSHLHEFEVNGLRYSDPGFFDGDFDMREVSDETAVTLRQLVASGTARFTFLYDFGDSWFHEVELENTNVEPLPGVSYPTCIAGQRACPPEDCGGVSGYENLLEALADPQHEDHQTLRRWVGKAYDSEKLRVADVNAVLAKRFVPARRSQKLSGRQPM